LTYNYGVDSYDIGEGFGHFGVALPDVYKAAETIKAAGGEVSSAVGPPLLLMEGGGGWVGEMVGWG
jgi:lactoylglutathione lyase